MVDGKVVLEAGVEWYKTTSQDKLATFRGWRIQGNAFLLLSPERATILLIS